MSNILDKFEICSTIGEHLRSEVKLLYVFKDIDTDDEILLSALFVTIDDRVFGVGDNQWGVLGLGHEEKVEKPNEVKELKHKKIKQFTTGVGFGVALTEDNRVYIWGSNNADNKNEKPEALEMPFTEDIVQICCGYYHSLILTYNGRVYAFGDNASGQLGCTPCETGSFDKVLRLIDLNGHYIKFISAGYHCSLVVTNDGEVYSWGEISHLLCRPSGEDNHYKPLLVPLSNVMYICVSEDNTYFITEEGQLYYTLHRDDYGEEVNVEDVVPIRIDISQINFNSEDNRRNKRQRIGMKLKSFCGMSFGSTVIINDEVFELEDNYLTKTKFRSLFDYYCNVHQITPTTVEVRAVTEHMKWMANAFNNPEESNFKFKLKKSNNEDNYNYIYVQKFVLKKTEYFRRMFANHWSENESNEIEIQDYSYESYYQYLRWIYTECVDTEEIDVLLEMLSISDQYLDQNFKDKCVIHLKSFTTLSNIWSVYSSAIKFRAKELEDFCFSKMSVKLIKVTSSEEYQSMDGSVAKEFLKKLAKKNK